MRLNLAFFFLVFLLSTTFLQAYDKPAPQQDHEPREQRPPAGEKPKTLRESLNNSPEKEEGLKAIAQKLQNNSVLPYDQFNHLFDSESIDLSKVRAAAEEYFKEDSIGNARLKFFIALESTSYLSLMACLEKLDQEGMEKIAQVLPGEECGLPASSHIMGDPELAKILIQNALERKLQEWSYVLGISPAEAKEFLIKLQMGLAARNNPDYKERAAQLAGQTLAEFIGSKPKAALQKMLDLMKNVPQSEQDSEFRRALQNAVQWADQQASGDEVRNAFNEWYFKKEGDPAGRQSVAKNKETFWGLVDRAKEDPTAKAALLTNYSQHLPTFLRTLYEQAKNGKTPDEKKAAREMLTDLEKALQVNEDGKPVLHFADRTDKSKVIKVDLSQGDLGNYASVMGYTEEIPEKGRFVPSHPKNPQVYSSIIPGGHEVVSPSREMAGGVGEETQKQPTEQEITTEILRQVKEAFPKLQDAQHQAIVKFLQPGEDKMGEEVETFVKGIQDESTLFELAGIPRLQDSIEKKITSMLPEAAQAKVEAIKKTTFHPSQPDQLAKDVKDIYQKMEAHQPVSPEERNKVIDAVRALSIQNNPGLANGAKELYQAISANRDTERAAYDSLAIAAGKVDEKKELTPQAQSALYTLERLAESAFEASLTKARASGVEHGAMAEFAVLLNSAAYLHVLPKNNEMHMQRAVQIVQLLKDSKFTPLKDPFNKVLSEMGWQDVVNSLAFVQAELEKLPKPDPK